jgi:hypothetical protein
MINGQRRNSMSKGNNHNPYFASAMRDHRKGNPILNKEKGETRDSNVESHPDREAAREAVTSAKSSMKSMNRIKAGS